MNVEMQIISILFSFFFGVLFSVLTNINYKFLFAKNKIYQIFFTVIYVLDASLLYFLIMKELNDGIIHFYFILFIACGFFTSFIYLDHPITCLKSKIKEWLKSVKK